MLALLKANPAGAKTEKDDDDGSLPLHCAAENQAPLEVVEALLRAHGDGAKEKSKDGWLPLHHAAKRQAPPEVVEALLRAHEDGAKEKD